MTIKQFAQDMMSDLETYCKPYYMTRANAAYNLKCYQDEGRKLPRGINEKNFADAWNDLLPYSEDSVQAEAQGIADVLPYSLSVYEALARLISNMKANGHMASITFNEYFDIDLEGFKLVRNKSEKTWKVRPTFYIAC